MIQLRNIGRAMVDAPSSVVEVVAAMVVIVVVAVI